MNELTQTVQKKIEHTAIAYQPYLARVAAALVVLCALSAFMYGIFLLEAVGQAASRTSAERQIRELSGKLSMLEGDYLAATKELTPDLAHKLGYVAPAKVRLWLWTALRHRCRLPIIN